MPLGKQIERFIKTHRHKLSEWFSESAILNDGYFTSTQPANTTMPQAITFCNSLKYIDFTSQNPNIACIITTKALSDRFINVDKGLVVVDRPQTEFSRLHNELAQKYRNQFIFSPMIEPSAAIHPTATIDDNCFIGKNVEIGAGARILSNSYVADHCAIGPNVVIGSEGLEFKRRADSTLLKIAHMGGVYLGPHVEVMANSVICRDVYLGFTRIGLGTKIGPLCDIAHRSQIGSNCLIAGNSTIGGSTKVGNTVWIGPSATTSDGITIGDRAKISLGSVVIKDVNPGQTVSGFFAIDHQRSLHQYAVLNSK